MTFLHGTLDFFLVSHGFFLILGKDGLLRNMPPEKLLKSLPILQTQVDSLLEFDVRFTDDDLTTRQ